MNRIIEKLLKEEYLIESGIKIPNGTKSAKIFGHADLDGFFSMMLVYNQLIKQGIPKDRIRLNFIQYGFIPSELAKNLNVKKGEMTAMVDFGAVPPTYKENGETKNFRAPDFWSDHHQLNPEAAKLHKKSSGKIGETKYKSDSEHIATVHAEGIADYNTIREITKVDSAKFSSLDNNIFYTNEFIGKDRNEKLAILTAVLTNDLIKKNPEAAKDVIRKAKPTLISIYSTVKRYMNLTRLQNDAINELSKDDPDWNIIDKARKAMPTKEMRNKIQRGEKIMNISDRESLNKKQEEDIKKAQSGWWSDKDEAELQRLDKKDRTEAEDKKYKELKALKETQKGNFKFCGNTIVQRIPTPSLATNRYLPAVIFNKENKRVPFIIKKWSDGIQVCLNPDINNKDGIDLVADMKEIIDKTEQKFATKENGWIFRTIKEKSGGHAAITNISSVGMLGMLDSKEKRDKFKELKNIDDKLTSLRGIKSKDEKFAKKLKNLTFDVISKKRNDEYQNLLKEKETKSEYKKKIMNYMLVEFVKLLNRKYKDRKVEKESKHAFGLN